MKTRIKVVNTYKDGKLHSTHHYPQYQDKFLWVPYWVTMSTGSMLRFLQQHPELDKTENPNQKVWEIRDIIEKFILWWRGDQANIKAKTTTEVLYEDYPK